MHLKSLKISNFRKFGDTGNEIEFVASNTSTPDSHNRIACSTTLIVGKNNSGKTTVTKALQKLVTNNIKAGDFNYRYLKRLFDLYKVGNFDSLPILKFNVVISINADYTDSTVNVCLLYTS